MAGTFPGTAACCQIDQNGQPLQAGLLYVYAGGTTTPSNTFQDIGLIIPAQNPLVLDNNGRVPLFFVADGTYHIRLIDRFGTQQFDYPQVPSIGASSSGGGGAPVDPTTVFQTGDVIWVDVAGLRTGWVRDNGRSIGNGTSGGTERANADCQALFIFLYTSFANSICTVSGGRTGNALNDFNAGKTILLPDKRGSMPIGLADMGSTDTGTLAGIPAVLGVATSPGSILGENLHTITVAELASHGHAIVDNHQHQTAAIAGKFAITANTTAGGGAVPVTSSAGEVDLTGSNTSTTNIGSIAASANGSSTPHNTVSRSVVGTFYRKL